MRPGSASGAAADASCGASRPAPSSSATRGSSRGALGIVVAIDAGGPAERDAALEAIDRASRTRARRPRAGRDRGGQARRPALDRFVLERQTGGHPALLPSSARSSWCSRWRLPDVRGAGGDSPVARRRGAARRGGRELLGFGFTIVSSLVPLTLMITTSASLVYLHSRFVDQPQASISSATAWRRSSTSWRRQRVDVRRGRRVRRALGVRDRACPPVGHLDVAGSASAGRGFTLTRRCR